MADWWDQNNLGFLAGDQVDKPVYSGGSGSFDEKMTNGQLSAPTSIGGAFGKSDPNFKGDGNYQDLDLTQQGTDYGSSVGPDGSGWVQTIAGPRQIAPAGTYGADGKVIKNGSAGGGNTGPAATTNAQASGGSGNYQQQVEGIMGGANEMTPDKISALEAAGFKVTPPNASGERSKIQLPTGEWVRIIGQGEGHPVWMPQGASGTSYSMSGATGGNQYSGMGASQQELQSYGVPANQYASHAYTGGYQAPQWNQSFTAPTDVTMQNDPGYQFRMKMGQQALERSAAAKGTILNGGTQQATEMFGQDYGSNEYANVFQRAFDQYKQKYGEFQNAADLGLRAEQNQYGEYLGEQNRTLSDYLTNYQIGRTGVQDFLGQQNKTADRGLSATLGGKP